MLAHDLLEIARQLVDNDKLPEYARLRSAANRAYYALFRMLMDFLDPDKVFMGGKGVHSKLSKTLGIASRKDVDVYGRLCDNFERLEDRRIEADYIVRPNECDFEWSSEKVIEDCIDRAREGIETIEDLTEDELRDLIGYAEDAARRFEEYLSR